MDAIDSEQENTTISAELFGYILDDYYRGNLEYKQYYTQYNGREAIYFKNINVSQPIRFSLNPNKASKEYLIFSNCKISEIKYVGRGIKNLIIEGESKFDKILIEDCDDMQSIEIMDDSEIDRLSFFNYKADNFKVSNKAKLGKAVFARTFVKKVTLSDESKLDEIELSNESNIVEFELSTISKIQKIIISDKSKAFQFKVTNSYLDELLIIADSNIGKLLISNSTISKIEVTINSRIDEPSILEKAIISIFDINEHSIVGDFNINESEIRDLSITESTSGYFAADKSNIRHIIINLNSKTGYFMITGSQIGFFSIDDHSQMGNFYSSDKSICGNIWLSGASRTKSFFFENSSINTFNIHNVDVDNQIRITNCDTLEFTIGNINSIDEIKVNGGYIGIFKWESLKPTKIFLEKVKLQNIDFTMAVLPKNNVIQFNDCFVNLLKFDSTQNEGTLSFKNMANVIRIREYQLDKKGKYIIEDGKYIFKDKNSKAIITLQNSDLGRTSFIGCYFPNFRFEFFNSKLLEIFLAGTIMPTKIEVPEKHIEIGLEQQKLAYGQLKRIFENMGDSVKALNYKALELEAYRNILKTNKSGRQAELLNLWFMHYSSFYGTDWWRALKLLGAFSLVSYVGYCFMLGNSFGLDFELFVHKAVNIMEFINPLHKSNELMETVWPQYTNGYMVSLAFVWEQISRIIIGVLIYQTIQAFRKHGKPGI